MNRISYKLIVILLILNSSFTTVLIAAEHQPRRFSIAISGGASKGAYEAGLNWGLLKLIRGIDKIDSTLMGQTHAFEAASFTGASAGGTNTLLSGVSWCSLPEAEGGLPNSINANIFRDVWLAPDVNQLLPPTADSIYYASDDALLSRYNLLQASQKLRERWNKPGFRPNCRIPLGVTVTRVIPEELLVGNVKVQNQRLFIPFEARTQENGTLGFYFNPSDYPALLDPSMILMPHTRNRPTFSIDDQRIEDAVLTSAAFPGGFGRKRLQYCRLASYTATNDTDRSGQEKIPPDEAMIQCPEGYELAVAEFADGSLFDNLPIGLARRLAEQQKYASENILPVTYFYLDPDRLRFVTPPPADTRACASNNPPADCQIMEYSLFTEQTLLLGALGTARKYELYRELTSEHWSLNLAQLSYELSEKLAQNKSRLGCQKEIPFFKVSLSCAESVRRAGSLMELAYNQVSLPIMSPYSAEKLSQAGITHNCQYDNNNPATNNQIICEIDVVQYRHRLTDILLKIAGEESKRLPPELIQRIKKTKISMHNDRIIRVSSRGAPITGTLLHSFGAFLDLKFREYDYYVGVYDAIVAAAHTLCGLKFPENSRSQKFLQCQDEFAQKIYHIVGMHDDPRGRYIFALLARWEFGKQNTFRFAYDPLPAEDRDMHIIFDGLIKTLEAGEQSEIAKQGIFFTEDTFFLHLFHEGFEPTPTDDGSRPLLAQIMADPTNWPAELTRRMTTRNVYLEQQAEAIYAAREPDPKKRENSNTMMMGLAAYSLQTATYNYPEFTFTPSTAPENWAWRNVIPYELGFDFADGDILFTWQPTWAMTNRDLLGVRAGLGFAGGLIQASSTNTREDYGTIGLDYTHRTSSAAISSWGLTPTWYHTWNNPIDGRQDALGGDVHISFLKDRLRIGLGARDLGHTSDTWFLTIGLTDLPGLSYWLTR